MTDKPGVLARLRRAVAARGGRDPSPAGPPPGVEVDPAFYLVTNPDVAASGLDPSDHFASFGWREGRDPRPDHSLGHPSEGRRGSARRDDYDRVRAEFDAGWYLTGFAGGEAPADPFLHYLAQGWRQGRDPRPDFSVRHYLARYPDIRDAGLDPFVHYVLHGRAENRDPDRPIDEPRTGPIAVPDGRAGDDLRPVAERLSRRFGVPVVPVAPDFASLPARATAVLLGPDGPDRLAVAAAASGATALPVGAGAVSDESCFALLRRIDPGLPAVSVVVPNYRYARYLPERLATVFAQTHPVREVIVLDDASPDDSVEVIRRVADEAGRDIDLHVSAANSGSPFAQWRRGLELAQGDLVWIAEADDLARPDLLARLAGRLRAGDAVLAFSDSWQVDSDGTRIGDSYRPAFDRLSPGLFAQAFDMDGAAFVRQALHQQNVIPNVSAAVFRREALLGAMDRVRADLADLAVAGDWRLYLELCATGGRVAYVPDALNGHRLHLGSVTHALRIDRHLHEIALMHRTAARIAPLGPDQVAGQAAYLDRARAHLLGLADRAGKAGA